MTRSTHVAAVVGALALTMSVAACSSDDSGGEGGGGYCDQIQGFIEEYQGLDESVLQDDPETLNTVLSDLHSIADAAPDDIQADWNTVADAFDTLATFSQETPDPEDTEAMEEQTETVADMQEATQNVNTHASEECDIELG